MNNCTCKCHVSNNECCDICCIYPIVNLVKNINEHKNYQIDENRKISRRVDELHAHIDKLHEMINMEDRITASDVFCRLTKLESSISNWEQEFYFLKDKLRNNESKPHPCPICDGRGGFFINGTMDEECYACEGRSIVWS